MQTDLQSWWNTYTVGEGIANAMREENDAPATDEAPWSQQGQANFAMGVSGVTYVWVQSTNAVYKFRPRPAR